MRPLRCFMIACAAVLSLPIGGSADIIRVPTTQPTIQAALAAAVPGDTVLVAAGVYVEHGLSLRSEVALIGEPGDPAAVVIDAQFWGRVCSGTGLASSTVIRGITFRNGFSGYSAGGGMALYSSSPKIRRVVFRGNASYVNGGALYCELSSPTLSDVLFEGNDAYFNGTGGGAAFYSGSNALIEDCEFRDNHAESGGGAYCSGANVTVRRVLFENNSSAVAGGALCCSGASELQVEHATFRGNTAGEEGGGFSCHSGPTQVAWSTFHANQAGQRGGGLSCVASMTLGNTTFHGNGAAAGGAVYCEYFSPWLNRVILAFSTSGEGISGYGNARPVLACCDVYGNAGGEYGGTVANQTGLVGNISENPLFCDPSAGDLTLDAGSPCAAANSECGLLVGAWDVGCGWPSPVQPTSWGLIKARYR